MKNFFGVKTAASESFLHTWHDLLLPYASNIYALIVATGHARVALALRMLQATRPGMLIAMVIGSLIVGRCSIRNERHQTGRLAARSLHRCRCPISARRVCV